MSTLSRVSILTTGGTIEKSYFEKDGSLRNVESLLREKLLERLRLPHIDIEIHELMAKDSLEMTPEDRELILLRIKKEIDQDRSVLILHGTDTLAETYQLTRQKFLEAKVPIVFTGAMKPVGFEDSDARQNFTEALFACRVVPPGVYVSFHGSLHEGPSVKKNRDRGTFESIGG